MRVFRLYLFATLVALATYTLLVGSQHGWNLLPLFFASIATMAWSGQFNCDFLAFLGLSGIWVAWRHHFSPWGMVLGVVAVFGGMLFLGSYLLYHSVRSGGDIKKMLLGEARSIS